MEYDVSIVMALFDFVPVLLLGASAALLIVCFYGTMSTGAFAAFAAGMGNIFFAGIFKAVWKLLYAAGICNFVRLAEALMPMQFLGFILAAAALLHYVITTRPKKKSKSLVLHAVPPLYTGTLVFVPVMAVGLLMISVNLSILAGRKKRFAAIPFFLLYFVSCIAMSALAGMDTTTALVNWLEEIFNSVGSALFLVGCILFTRRPGSLNP